MMNSFTQSQRVAERIGIARLLDAASDPTRLNIMFLLGQEQRLNVGEIAARFPQISRPAVSHHLRVLKDAGAVHGEKIGQEVFYTLDRARVVEALRDLAGAIEACCPPGAA